MAKRGIKWSITSLKTKGRQFDNFVVTGGTESYRNDNLRCHQSRKSCQIDKFSFTMILATCLFCAETYCPLARTHFLIKYGSYLCLDKICHVGSVGSYAEKEMDQPLGHNKPLLNKVSNQWDGPRIFIPSGHCPEIATNNHVSTYFR